MESKQSSLSDINIKGNVLLYTAMAKKKLLFIKNDLCKVLYSSQLFSTYFFAFLSHVFVAYPFNNIHSDSYEQSQSPSQRKMRHINDHLQVIDTKIASSIK